MEHSCLSCQVFDEDPAFIAQHPLDHQQGDQPFLDALPKLHRCQTYFERRSHTTIWPEDCVMASPLELGLYAPLTTEFQIPVGGQMPLGINTTFSRLQDSDPYRGEATEFYEGLNPSHSNLSIQDSEDDLARRKLVERAPFMFKQISTETFSSSGITQSRSRSSSSFDSDLGQPGGTSSLESSVVQPSTSQHALSAKFGAPSQNATPEQRAEQPGRARKTKTQVAYLQNLLDDLEKKGCNMDKIDRRTRKRAENETGLKWIQIYKWIHDQKAKTLKSKYNAYQIFTVIDKKGREIAKPLEIFRIEKVCHH